jgi:hypothetical protein
MHLQTEHLQTEQKTEAQRQHGIDACDKPGISDMPHGMQDVKFCD